MLTTDKIIEIVKLGETGETFNFADKTKHFKVNISKTRDGYFYYSSFKDGNGGANIVTETTLREYLDQDGGLINITDD